MTPPQANTGETVAVTISGSYFGFNPQIQIIGTGVQPAITSATTTEINALFSVADAAIAGERGVRVKSLGYSGTGFQSVPGISDTSNSVDFNVLPLPTVQIQDVPLIEKNGIATVLVSVSGTADYLNETTFYLERTSQAGTGEAGFSTGSGGVSSQISVRGDAENFRLRIKGITESSQADNIRIKAKFQGNDTVLQQKVFTVAAITSIVFEKFDASYIIPDDNPGIDGVHVPDEGLRIYPDKKDIADITSGTDRSLIKVKATITPALPNLNVYFANFDLDDPSADTTPVDTTGSDGKDNNGDVSGSKSGLLAAFTGTTCTNAVTGSAPDYIGKLQCVTNSAGTITLQFKTTMQPGDNFAVAASLKDTNRDGMKVNSANGAEIIDSSSQVIPITGEAVYTSGAGIRTEMLTVWRKLHIEVDSMGAASDNKVEGNLTDTIKVSSGNQTLNLSVSNLKVNRFENGSLVIKRGNPAVVFKTLSVIATTYVSATDSTIVDNANTASSVTVINNTGAFNVSPSDSFTLYDDDDMNDDGVFDGDEGDVVPEPDRGLLQSVDIPCPSAITANNCNDFASAYVLPKYDLTGNQRDVPFSESVTDSDIDMLVQTYFQNKATEANEDFWTIYLLGLYQRQDIDPNTPLQSDPDRSGARYGQSLTLYSSVFLELSRPTEYNDLDRVNVILGNGAASWTNRSIGTRFTTAHEVGHLFGCDHFDGGALTSNYGVMGLSATRTSSTFNDYSLNIIRMRKHP